MRKNWLNSTLEDPGRRPWFVALALAVVNAGLWIFVIATFPRDMPAAVLHYSVGVGIDFVGEGRQIIVLPAVSSVLLVLNVLLAFMLRKVNMVASWILLGGAAVVQLLLIAAYFFILALN